MNFVLLLLFWVFGLSFLHADFPTETLDQINIVRQKAGLGMLTADPNLMSIAQEWAEKLAAQQFLQHRSMGGLKEFLLKYQWHGIDENLHASTSTPSPVFVVQSWMGSPEHHDNLLRPKITKGGIGVKNGSNGLTYVVFNGAF